MVRKVLAVAALLASSSLALTPSGCATLGDIERGQCGNRVVEPGEDCDGTPADRSFLCAPRDADHACRFVWETDPAECPTDTIPGDDKRCRKPSGLFAYAGVSFDMPGGQPHVGDMDGDGVADVGLSMGADDLGSGERFHVVYSIASGAPVPIEGFAGDVIAGGTDLSDDGLSDIVLAGDGGLTALRSRNGSIQFKLYANPGLEAYSLFASLPLWLVPPGALPRFLDPDSDLSLLALMFFQGGDLSLCLYDNDCPEEERLIWEGIEPGTPFQFDYDDAHVVAAGLGGKKIYYLSRETQPDDGPPVTIDLLLEGSPTIFGGPYLADVDGDGLSDIVALAGDDQTGTLAIFVLPGRPPEAPAVHPVWTAADVLRPWLDLSAIGFSSTFSVARFNADAIPDFALSAAMLLSRGAPLVEPAGAPPSFEELYRYQILPPAEQHIVGDLDADGLDDLALQGTFGAASTPPILVTFGGDLLPLVQVELEAAGNLARGALGDFDGDGAGDLALAFSQTSALPGELRSCDEQDELFFAFGRSGGFPEAPQSVGVLPPVEQVHASRLALTFDGFGDFVVAAACQGDDGIEASNAVVRGNPFRLPLSPFLFSEDVQAKAAFTAEVVALPGLDATSEGVDQPHGDIVLVVQSQSGGAASGFVEPPEATLLPSWADVELDESLARPLPLPARWLANGGESGLGDYADLDVAAEKNRVAMAGAANGYPSSVKVEADVSVLVVPDEGEVSVLGEWELPPLETDLTGAFVEITAFDLNGDAVNDYAVVYGARQRQPIVASTEPGGGSNPGYGDAPGFASALALIVSQGDGFEVIPIEGFDAGANQLPVEALVVGGELLIVGTEQLYRVDLAARRAEPSGLLQPWPGVSTDAVTSDFDGDGLEDLLVLDGRLAHLVSQLPVNP